MSPVSESPTRIISYSGLDETYYVTVPRRSDDRRKSHTSATLAIPKTKLQPDSDQELESLLTQAECDLAARERDRLREKSRQFNSKRH